MKKLLRALLPLLLWSCPLAMAELDAEHPAPPEAGSQLREIAEQNLPFALGDHVERIVIAGPDAPYEVHDFGIALPPGLCERSRSGCRGEVSQ